MLEKIPYNAYVLPPSETFEEAQLLTLPPGESVGASVLLKELRDTGNLSYAVYENGSWKKIVIPNESTI